MNISLSDHFSYRKLLSFVIPSIIMMIISSVYSIVDGIFVSNFVGKTPFAALNLIFPVTMMVSTIGFMIGTGGSALVGMKLGEGKKNEANQCFTMFIVVDIIVGIIISAICFYFMPQIAALLGADSILLDDCVLYGRVLMISSTFFSLQCTFQNFMVTAEKPKLGLIVTIVAGVGNIVFDFILIYFFKLGLFGAALATSISQILGALIPIVYFSKKRNSILYLCKFKFSFKSLCKGCSNGMSEMLSNISRSLVSMLYNIQLLKFAAENGVAAYGVIMYVSFIFIAIFLGYSIGSAPLISYNFGANNTNELKNIFKKSMILIGITSIVMVFLGVCFSTSLSKIFVGYDKKLLEFTAHGVCLYSLSYIFVGFNIFASSFFTALNNGLISAILSISKTLIFEVGCILILPIFFDIDGIWLAILVAETLSVIMALFFFIKYRKKYKYI